jgi:hypothetical protein
MGFVPHPGVGVQGRVVEAREIAVGQIHDRHAALADLLLDDIHAVDDAGLRHEQTPVRGSRMPDLDAYRGW